MSDVSSRGRSDGRRGRGDGKKGKGGHWLHLRWLVPADIVVPTTLIIPTLITPILFISTLPAVVISIFIIVFIIVFIVVFIVVFVVVVIVVAPTAFFSLLAAKVYGIEISSR